MFAWSVVIFLLMVVSAFIGFTDVSTPLAGFAKVMFFIFFMMFFVMLVIGITRSSPKAKKED
ncbi:MAG: DUF1328 domain-containing protein [candidate division Zixibacteria bacterium]|nr:DUF1328 domain-containing protein [candidate division Zixibacteria bacterium]